MALPQRGAAGNGGRKIKEAHAYEKTVYGNSPPATQGAAEGGMLMFTARERTLLTSPYFRLIRQTDDFFEIQSRCTKHCWIVQKLSYDRYPVRIYHKHTKGTAYYLSLIHI